MSTEQKYYFFLGNTPDLSLLELKSLLSSAPTQLSPLLASYDGELNLEDIGVRLAGTRKIARTLTSCAPGQVLSEIATILRSLPNKNVAITDYAELKLTQSEIRGLKDQVDRPLRFVSLDTGEHELVMLAHQHVAELNLIRSGENIIIAHTVWIFDAEDWIRRDRNKPYRDIKRGMLPPKLARMLVNIATQGKSGLSLSDPFCGTGTVLTEATLAGCAPLYGSDTNPAAVTGAEENLLWLKSTFNLPDITAKFSLTDATHLHSFVSVVDAIVTEPYMGPLLDDRNPLPLSKIQDIAKGLDKLYRGCFKSWGKILPVGGRVVMTIPSFAVYGRVIPTISIDTISSLGYNYISSVAYGKPGAVVIRNITILERQ